MKTQTSYFKKALVVLMAVMMVFTMMPGMAWAADVTDTGGEQATTVASGNCGSDDVTYTLYSDGRLVIRGTGSTGATGAISKVLPTKQEKAQVTGITIEGNVDSIGQRVFSAYTNLKSVDLGSVTSIGDAAFSGCANLESIRADSVTSIGKMAFFGCTNLESIQADSVTSIGGTEFSSCTKIKTISLKALTDSSKIPITPSLESLTIGEKTDSKFISNLAKASSLKVLNIPEANKSLKVENSLLLSKNGTNLYYTLRSGETNITIPNTVTLIGKNAFANYSELTHVTLSDSLQTISASAFNACTGLTEMLIPRGVTTIDSTAFSGCSNLKAFTMNGEGETYRVQNGILFSDGGKAVFMVPPQFSGVFAVPSGVVSIGANAFKNCTGLSGVTFADSLTTIGANAFDGCVGLQTVEIPTSVTTIGSSAFANCKNLEIVKLPQTLTNIAQSTFMNCTALKTIELPATLTEIGRRTFAGCLSLENITLPSGLTTLNDGAFQNSGITSLTIPESVSSIPENMCQKCTKLETIYIPKTITAIGNNAFSATGLKTIYFAGSYDAWTSISNNVQPSIPVVCYYGAEEITGDFIKAQPQNQTFTEGVTNAGSKPLSITVTGQTDGESLEFHWYVNTKKATQGGTKVAADKVTTKGSSSQCVVDTTAAGNYYYYCLIVKTKGETVSVKWSDFAQVAITYQAAFQGKGTAQEPYQIRGQEDLINLQTMVNGGASMAGIYFKLLTDVELPAGWVPMGCLKDSTNKNVEKGTNLNAFSANLDGGGHTITVPENGKPLLGYVWNASVKNLKIQGKKIDGYGLVNNYTGIDLDGFGIVIDHVTVLSGTNIAESGLLGSSKKEYMAGASAVFASTIRNCIIEQDVSIGSETTDAVGSIAGRFHGTIENCVSYADVMGRNYVGGILGTRDNAMGDCIVKNCKFYGTVKGQKHVGGIVGGGYGYGGTANGDNDTAPNGIRVTILSCAVGDTAKVSGTEHVGGILGGDSYVAQAWNSYAVVANTFSGKVSGQTNVGGIIGFYDSLNKFDNIAGNFYTKNCGATSGIGAVKYVDTNYKNPTKVTGTTYFNTEKGVSECPEVKGCKWKAAHNRTDDPLGADKEKLTKAVDSIPTEAFAYELVLKSGNVKTEYLVGDAFNFGDAVFAAKMTDGTEKSIDTKDIKVSGYNANSHTVQTVMLTYGYAQMEVQVAVKLDSTVVKKDKLSVGFTLLGESKHDSDTDKKVHGLAMGGLTPWTSGKYEVDLNATVWDLMQQVQQNNSNITFNTRGSQYGTYVYAVTYNNTTLGELDNGKLSGWMYTVNGTHPEVGVGSRFLNDGDTVVFHYTDDYTKEEGSDKWNTPAAGEEAKDVMTSGTSGSAVTSAPTEVKVTEKKNADGTKETVADVKVAAEHQDEIIKQAAEKKSAEIILEVSAANTKGADSVQLSLDVTFVKNVADKTDADLTVNTENGKVTLDQETIKTVLAETKGATITLEVSKVAKPTEAQKQAAGANGHLLKLTIKSGDRVISDFNKGKVKVVAEIVSKLLDKKVAAIHIADDGKIEQLAGRVLTIGGKKYYEFTTPHFSTFALVDADELGLEVKEEPQTDVKALTAKLTPVARSAKTAKKNVKVTTSLDKQDKAIIQELKDAGYAVKYRFYRSTKKAAGYKAAVTKKTSTYTNTSGKKGTKYYYKVQVRVYDANGKLAAKTALKQCRYAARVWSK